MRIYQTFLPLVTGALLLTACSSDKDPANNAVTQADAALSPMRDDASKFAPDELKAADTTLAKMKDNLAKEDYKAVVADVPQFNTQVRTLQESVVQKQTLAAAAQNEWDTLNAEVPKAVEAIQIRVDGLKGTRLPKEITKENYEAAKTDLEALKATWAEATTAAAAGDPSTAAEKGRTAAAKVEEIKTELAMTPALASSAPTMTPPSGADIAPTN